MLNEKIVGHKSVLAELHFDGDTVADEVRLIVALDRLVPRRLDLGFLLRGLFCECLPNQFHVVGDPVTHTTLAPLFIGKESIEARVDVDGAIQVAKASLTLFAADLRSTCRGIDGIDDFKDFIPKPLVM